MPLRFLVLLLVASAQLGCDAEYGEGFYPFRIITLNREGREALERQKRKLQIEDIKIGDGLVAAWEGRRLRADIEVRYADGTLVYKGPIVTYVGFHVELRAGDALTDPNLLSFSQGGIELGLNGMKVGGRRRVTVDPQLVCVGHKSGCYLLRPERHFVNEIPVHKQTLVVEATLTESCIPITFRAIYMNGSYFIHRVIGCRESDTPQLDPDAPIWRVY